MHDVTQSLSQQGTCLNYWHFRFSQRYRYFFLLFFFCRFNSSVILQCVHVDCLPLWFSETSITLFSFCNIYIRENLHPHRHRCNYHKTQLIYPRYHTLLRKLDSRCHVHVTLLSVTFQNFLTTDELFELEDCKEYEPTTWTNNFAFCNSVTDVNNNMAAARVRKVWTKLAPSEEDLFV